jgi:hypothetical protein
MCCAMLFGLGKKEVADEMASQAEKSSKHGLGLLMLGLFKHITLSTLVALGCEHEVRGTWVGSKCAECTHDSCECLSKFPLDRANESFHDRQRSLSLIARTTLYIVKLPQSVGFNSETVDKA